MAREAPPRLGRRGVVLLAIALAALASFYVLDAPLGGLVPQTGGLAIVREFFAHMLRPALVYETAVPPGTPPLLLEKLAALRRTLVFAVAAMSHAVPAGVVVGFQGAKARWSGGHAGGGAGSYIE